jgi:flagellin
MVSINTFSTSFSTLNQISNNNRFLSDTQDKVSTGLRINAKNDPSSFAVAQGLRSDIRSFDAVDRSLAAGKGPAVTAISGGSLISSLLSNTTTSAILALNPANTQEQTDILSADFNSQVSQINSLANGASFGQTNLINGSSANGINVTAAIDGTQTNIAGDDFTAAGLNGLDTLNIGATTLPAALTQLQGAQSELNLGIATIAGDLNQAEGLQKFGQDQQDAITIGLGSLADSDLARENSNLNQETVKQQLQFQILAQQNRSQSRSVLSLFA